MSCKLNTNTSSTPHLNYKLISFSHSLNCFNVKKLSEHRDYLLNTNELFAHKIWGDFSLQFCICMQWSISILLHYVESQKSRPFRIVWRETQIWFCLWLVFQMAEKGNVIFFTKELLKLNQSLALAGYCTSRIPQGCRVGFKAKNV